ncbi:MAG: PEP-CTERM sorting domain-containing protein, partial [Burkholderiaceae bacterium]|nr:PEP-CTERM sorting domain-containing protein [Burkholderiaceae bacterium]
ADLVVGNGIDEQTRGTFDFRADDNYSAFVDLVTQPGAKITAAVLSLVLIAGDWLDPFFRNDQISLENGPFVGDPQIGQQLDENPFLEGGMAKLVTLNLLDFYSQEQLRNFLSGGVGDFFSDGRIVLTYGDDAFVTGANLRLTSFISEPSTLALLPLGLMAGVMLGAFRNKRR